MTQISVKVALDVPEIFADLARDLPLEEALTGEQIRDVLGFLDEFESQTEFTTFELKPYKAIFAFVWDDGFRAAFLTSTYSFEWACLGKTKTFGPDDILDELRVWKEEFYTLWGRKHS